MPTPERGSSETRQRAQQLAEQSRAEGGKARLAAAMFLVGVAAAVALLVIYIAGGQTQLEGLALFVAFTGIGLGLAIWVKQIIGPAVVVEDRPLMGAAREEREQFARDFAESLGEARTGGRRRFLARLALGAGGAVGVALLAPIRSLGPGTENELFETPWSAGERVVGEDGEPIRADSVIPDQVLTVFPESAPRSADGQAVLIGLRPDLFVPSDLPAETVENTVCYSKICTHAGCPVGLYRAAAGQLLCPCHQSTFDVYDGAEPVSGPAGRALPQLPLGVDDEGFLVAVGEFIAPVGPTFWNFTDDPETA